MASPPWRHRPERQRLVKSNDVCEVQICRECWTGLQVRAQRRRAQQHQCAGNKRQVSSETQPNLAVPLRAALNTTYGRCLKQGSDTKHVPSKHKTWKKLSSYQLFVTQTKYERGFFDWPALLSPGEDMEGTLAPGTGDVLHGAPVLSTFALTATLVSVDFGKKVTTAEICHLNLISCCLWVCSPFGKFSPGS